MRKDILADRARDAFRRRHVSSHSGSAAVDQGAAKQSLRSQIGLGPGVAPHRRSSWRHHTKLSGFERVVLGDAGRLAAQERTLSTRRRPPRQMAVHRGKAAGAYKVARRFVAAAGIRLDSEPYDHGPSQKESQIMKSVDLLVADHAVCLRGRLTKEWAAAVIAALSADPWTCQELQHAVPRFVIGPARLTDEGLKSASWPVQVEARERRRGKVVGLLPDCVIDLPGRLLLTRWDQKLDPLPARIIGPDGPEGSPLRYHLDADWLISSEFDGWPQAVKPRHVNE